MNFVVAALRVAGLALAVEADVGCPNAPRAIEDRLRRLSPHQELRDTSVRLYRDGERLFVRLENADGASVAVRQLPTVASCEGIADAAAVVLAAWLAAAEPLPESSPPTPAAPRAVQHLDEVQVAPAPAGQGGWATELSLSALGSADSNGLGAALAFDVLVGPLFAVLLVQAPASASFGPGQLHWERESLGLGGSWRVRDRSPSLDLRALALASADELWGNGYPADNSGLGLGVGAGSGVRLSAPLGAGLRLLLDVSLALWITSPRGVVAGMAGSYTPPPLELFAGAGLTFEGLQ